jgi:hypothetical protein
MHASVIISAMANSVYFPVCFIASATAGATKLEMSPP